MYLNVADAAIKYLIGLGNGKSSSPALAVKAYSPFTNLGSSTQPCAQQNPGWSSR